MSERNVIWDTVIAIMFILWVVIPLIQIWWGSRKIGGMTDYGN